MTKSIAAARFYKTDSTKDTRVEDALEAALEHVREEAAGDTPIQHAIIMVGRSDEQGLSGTRYFQAGTYSHHAIMGLCFEAQQMMRSNADD